MNILFLDLSSKSTGWCASDKDGTILEYGCIQQTGKNVLHRILFMKQEILNIIKKYDIKKIVAEDVHPEEYGQKSHTERILMWLQGNIAVAAHEYNENNDSNVIEFMHSSEWRSQLGIKTGRGVRRDILKAADIQYIKNKYNISVNDDIADAICLHDAYFSLKEKNPHDWT